MKRLFFALWPDDATRQRFGNLIHNLQGYGRPVSCMNVHATLVFLGNLDEAKQAAMIQAADTIVIEPMRLTFDQLHYWKKPAVVCLCAQLVDMRVSALVEQLTAAALRNRIDIDSRPYKPHVTLLRKAKGLPQTSVESIVWQANGFCLAESCSTPHGVQYRVLKHWQCASAGAG